MGVPYLANFVSLRFEGAGSSYLFILVAQL